MMIRPVFFATSATSTKACLAPDDFVTIDATLAMASALSGLTS